MRYRIAYLCGEYPRTTDTFIQREIQSLRQQGTHVDTISVRRPPKSEQGFADQQNERERTHYLLPCNPFKLISTHLRLFFASPGRYLCSLHTAITIRSPGVRSLIYQLFYFAEAGLVADYVTKRNICHIHNHAPDSSGYVTMLASELSGCTFSNTIHGFGILSEPTKWRLTEKIERALFTICVSEHAKSQAMLWSDRKMWNKLHVVHCGVDCSTIHTKKVQSMEAQSLLFVGRFDHVKGIPILLEAVVILKDMFPDIILNIVGDGPEINQIEEIISTYKLRRNVRIHGYRSQQELPDFFRGADIFVMSSFAEGIPVVLMEAMAHGVPVVAPRITGIPELINDTVSGVLCTPGNAESLAVGIKMLLDDHSVRNKMAIEGRKTVEKHFDLVNETTQFASILFRYIGKQEDQCPGSTTSLP